jgi:hypothetical protein
MISFGSESRSAYDKWMRKLKKTARARITQVLDKTKHKFIPVKGRNFDSYEERVFDFHINKKEAHFIIKSLVRHGYVCHNFYAEDLEGREFTSFFLAAMNDETCKRWEKIFETYAFHWLFGNLNQQLTKAVDNNTGRKCITQFKVDFEFNESEEEKLQGTTDYRKHIFSRVFKWIDAITQYTAFVSPDGKSILIKYKSSKRARTQSQNRLNAVIFASLTIIHRKPAYSSSLTASVVEENKPDWHALPQTAMKLVIYFLVGKGTRV